MQGEESNDGKRLNVKNKIIYYLLENEDDFHNVEM